MGITRRFRAVTVPAVVAATVLALAASGAASGETSAGTGGQADKWHGWHSFWAATVMSPNSALTVGYVTDPCCHAISQHWDGTAWTFASPREGDNSFLVGVDSLSETDAWAVGMANFSEGGHSLAEHWDGRRWRIVDTGLGAFDRVVLGSVTMITSRNVWAVGDQTVGEGSYKPIIVHWDGATWTTVANPLASGSLHTIDAVSADDIWTYGSGGTLHWDGTAWSRVTMPIGDLRSLSAESSDNAWVVGGLGVPNIGHWDGKSWAAVESPPVGTFGGQLWSVTALSHNNAWAVGYTFADDQQTPGRALIEHWNGHQWRVVPSPHSGETFDILTAVDASSPNDVWAIGISGSAPGQWPYHGHRFMLHWDGSSWTRYPN